MLLAPPPSPNSVGGLVTMTIPTRTTSVVWISGSQNRSPSTSQASTPAKMSWEAWRVRMSPRGKCLEEKNNLPQTLQTFGKKYKITFEINLLPEPEEERGYVENECDPEDEEGRQQLLPDLVVPRVEHVGDAEDRVEDVLVHHQHDGVELSELLDHESDGGVAQAANQQQQHTGVDREGLLKRLLDSN